MPGRNGCKRTRLESKAFKAKVIKLRSRGKSTTQIGKELGVSRQYVSAVLIEMGHRIRDEQRTKKQARAEGEVQSNKERIEKAITQLEQRGEYSLGGLLRAVLERRKDKS